MPWVPTAQEEAQLKVAIKQKFGYQTPKDDASIAKVIGFLKGAKGKKQAEAVLRVATYAQIKTLSDLKLFDGLKDNSAATIEAAVKPQALQTAKVMAHNVQLENDRINGYLNSVSGGNFTNHRKGTLNKPLPIEDTVGNQVTTIARHYANGEQHLPVGSYVEWYPVVGGKRSPQKRFFTCSGDENRLWYTEGGTHGDNGEWWRQTKPGCNWERM
jgi:hypothetical protein